MKENKKVKPKKSIYLALVIVAVALVVYSSATFIRQRMSIGEMQKTLEDLNQQILIQNIKNDELSEVYNSTDSENEEYIEKIAREEYDYAKIGERIFVNISGE